MRNHISFIVAIIILSLPLLQCSRSNSNSALKNKHLKPLSDQFKEYWYSGKAEITSYTLEQSRYDDLHQGHVVLIFVTEDFSKSKQVKLDYPIENKNEKVSVLKMNYTKKFNTGIYPYSMMLSTFKPLDIPNPKLLKATMSSQEWCGHVFSQINLMTDHYVVSSYSYFEKEGDQQFNVPATILEDEIWSQIRLDYESLPIGEFEIIPGLFYTRLLHKPFQAVYVVGALEQSENELVYRLQFKDDERELSISFDKEFPHQITRWQETSRSVGGKLITTKAVLNKSLQIDYWNRNQNKDAYLRDSLGL